MSTRDGVRAVRDDHDGSAGLGPRAERSQNQRGVVVVEIAGRLVGQEQRGIVEDRPAKRDALLLASRELAWIVRPALEDAELLEEGERVVIEDALRQTNGNKAKAAQALGISTRTLYRKLEHYAARVDVTDG